MTETAETGAQADAPAIDKNFDPAEIEQRWYAHWESTGAFRPERPDAEPFTIVNPPPNVTGSLHIGHALDNTLQDVMVRYERLRGKDALWVVGMDHAGIATQMVVERELEKHQDKRTNYTREQFVDKVWEWKAQSGGQITGQLRRLGCSMDWSREQFTMDEHFSKAVLKVFVDLYNDGLIYRDKRLVNWDPKLKTAISDLEVETREVQGHFWHFKYPLADGATLDSGQDYIEVATTRPETMLADMAVAVNPEDPRYASVVGKHVVLPITGRRIPIVPDAHADPELGSGAVKITPGHDFNDFEVGKRAGIAAADMLNMLDAEAKVVQTRDGLIPADYIGMDRFDARAKVVADLKAQGFLIPHIVRDKDGNETEQDAEPRTIQTPYGDRGGVVIEPWLTDQWYVDAETLAKPAIEAVKSGAIEIVPKSWEKTYFHWMENIQPWCVSRQLWWGHRIPAWYGTKAVKKDDGTFSLTLGASGTPNETSWETFVADSYEEAAELAKRHYEPIIGKNNVVFSEGEFLETGGIKGPRAAPLDTGYWRINLYQEPDVLDTWFSSALWPFATLGWPESSPSPDGEGDHAQHGGGVSSESRTPPPPLAVPLPGKAGEDSASPAVRYKLPAKTNAAVNRAKALRRDMPPSETRLWGMLKERPEGIKFRRHHPAGDYVLDFFCPAAGLAIEVDGEAHNRGDRPERDARRDAFLRDCGVETMRVAARDVLDDLDAVVGAIVEKAKERISLGGLSQGMEPRPDQPSLLAKHYPNDLLISGFDILFFWDARMAMQGIQQMGQAPWKRLYLHGLVRAADGSKMSKSKGNTVDPLGLIDKYGADALRFFMSAMESQGRDIKMDEKRVEGYRNFATKLWNAARFAQSNGIGASTTLAAPSAQLAVNRWIIGEVVECQAALDKALEELRFDAAANTIYHFVWDRFCDWYLELIKGQIDDETRIVAGWVLDQILVMLHPFMPFITEELWHKLAPADAPRAYDLILAKWPAPKAAVDAEAKAEVEWLIKLVTGIRSARTELNVPPGAKITIYQPDKIEAAEQTLLANAAAIERMARACPVRLDQAMDTDATGSAQVIVDGVAYLMPLRNIIDIDAEKARLAKAREAVLKEAKSLEGRLSNPAFVEKAKPEAVEKARADFAEKSAEAERLSAALARLG